MKLTITQYAKHNQICLSMVQYQYSMYINITAYKGKHMIKWFQKHLETL